ncbi:hypothetical protein WN943_011973 [Citrus x changshan-huyou]
MTGVEAITETRIAIHNVSRVKRMKNVVENTAIIAATDMKSVASPSSNFLGNNRRKSSSAYRGVRMDKKFTTEAEEDTSDIASDMAKILKEKFSENFSRKNRNPVSSLLLRGTVKAATKTTVAMSVATNMHDVAVSFIHFSPVSLKSLCSFVNKALGVRPSLFLASANPR